MAKKHRGARSSKNGHSLPGSLLRGFLMTVLIGGVLLLLLSAVAFRTDDPTRYLLPLSTVALVLTAFFAGFTAAGFYRRHGILIGALAGIVFAVASAILAVVLAEENSQIPAARWISYPIIILLATLGGLFGGGRRVRGRSHR